MHHAAFPLMIPVDDSGLAFQGFITVNGEDHIIDVRLPDLTDPTSRGTLYTSPRMQHILRHHTEQIQRMLDQSDDLTLFLTELKNILEHDERIVASSMTAHSLSSNHYSILVAELKRVGYHTIQSMSDTMDKIDLEILDDRERSHIVRLTIPHNYPVTPATASADLPGTLDAAATSGTSLTTIVENIQSVIHVYQDLFDCMDELDTMTRILDPDHPTRKDMWRRIALGHHCSLHLEIDPQHPRQVPKVRFFGNVKRVASLKEKWHSALDQWDSEERPFQNLCKVLQLPGQHPTSQDSQGASGDTECAICYAYKLQHGGQAAQTPDVICANEQCNRGFHPSCLYEWLRSNPNTTRSFNILFGKCPYCGEVSQKEKEKKACGNTNDMVERGYIVHQ
ncbi:WD-repeat region-domain-containing protein [Radiomyces spectabilis]|uniref:WD-repeat region-domain-containing protein n=1 Tax=Radiomyces spectabilis TaxID=64574 RepID=UPI002220F65E|nr:WD-repeat region-domain-containing protein [Radiomyces spectabilis]KAI8381298.1 WD-repeat region-domain-containing protein [Radiomyces spectabilis]